MLDAVVGQYGPHGALQQTFVVGKGWQQVWAAVAEYIDWFNHRRLHSEIGLVPPAEFEADFYQHNPASASADALVPSL